MRSERSNIRSLGQHSLSNSNSQGERASGVGIKARGLQRVVTPATNHYQQSRNAWKEVSAPNKQHFLSNQKSSGSHRRYGRARGRGGFWRERTRGGRDRRTGAPGLVSCRHACGRGGRRDAKSSLEGTFPSILRTITYDFERFVILITVASARETAVAGFSVSRACCSTGLQEHERASARVHLTGCVYACLAELYSNSRLCIDYRTKYLEYSREKNP